jgi:uncharacterized protein YhhL (DUF1145 family)
MTEDLTLKIWLLITFFLLTPKPSPGHYILGTIELILLLILATEITLYADLKTGR